MKTIIVAAIAAFTFATPAMAQPAAQPAPATAPANSCTPEHAAMGHCTMPAPAQPATATAAHGPMSDCCRDANGNGKMDCCENMAGAAPAPTSAPAPTQQPQAHQGH